MQRGSAGILPAGAGAFRSRFTPNPGAWRGIIRNQGQMTGTSGQDARATARGLCVLAMTAHGRDARATAGRMPALPHRFFTFVSHT